MYCRISKRSYTSLLITEFYITEKKVIKGWSILETFSYVENNSTQVPLLICTWLLKTQDGKLKFDELDFAGYTGSRNSVRNRQKIQFVKIDFSEIKYRWTGVLVLVTLNWNMFCFVLQVLKILVQTNEDRLFVVFNNGLSLLYEAFNMLQMMFHEATACHVTAEVRFFFTTFKSIL